MILKNTFKRLCFYNILSEAVDETNLAYPLNST